MIDDFDKEWEKGGRESVIQITDFPIYMVNLAQRKSLVDHSISGENNYSLL